MGAVAAAVAGVSRLYGLGAVPTSPAYPYGTYSAALGRGDAYTLATEGVRWGRVVVQTFGKTPTSALAVTEAVRAALVDARLDITGYDTSPCRAELDPQVTRDPDDNGVLVVTTTFTFTATKEA